MGILNYISISTGKYFFLSILYSTMKQVISYLRHLVTTEVNVINFLDLNKCLMPTTYPFVVGTLNLTFMTFTY